MGVVLHVDGWRVEETVADVDGTGARTWREVVPPWGGQHFVATSGLRAVLRRVGLDVSDLKPIPPDLLSGFDDGCEQASAGRRHVVFEEATVPADHVPSR